MQRGAFLKGKLALVTGGSKGIGKGIAARLVELGATVAISGRNAADLEAAAKELSEKGVRPLTIRADVSRPDDVKRMFEEIDGAGRLDVLVNNAGVAIAKAFVDITPEEFDMVMEINARGAFLCGQEAMRRMAGRGGRIINISSASGLRGRETEGAYAPSKHAMMALSKVMALEGQKDGIIIQIICPNGVATPMIRKVNPSLDFNTMIAIDDLADAVEFLLNQDGNAFTDVLTLRRRENIPYPC